MLYEGKGHEQDQSYEHCGASRWIKKKNGNEDGGKPKAAKTLRYFPLSPRLQRLYMSRHTADDMSWHSKVQRKDGVLRHPADSPVGHIWMKCSKGPGNNIDVYLQPLVEELKILWNEGVQTYDAFKKEKFRLRAVVLWAINDFPAYAMFSGYSTKGFKACLVGSKSYFEDLSVKIALTLCELERIMPPSFFDIMEHLPIHLADEAAIGGPVQYRWMYPIEREHVEIEKRRRGRRSVQESERQANLSFFKYFKSKIREKINEGDVNIDPDIWALAEGPNNEAKCYKSNCYATANDHQPRDDMLDYYGVLTDIIKLDYHNGRKVLLFEGNWIDSRTDSRGLKNDEFGFISVNFKHLLPPSDTFIFATHAQQVFYVKDPIEPDWEVVVKAKPRDFFDMGIDLDLALYAPQQLGHEAVNEEDVTLPRTDISRVDLD
ncbi:hypothetical protein ACLB2K_041371 [Fragaria x ananassa]